MKQCFCAKLVYELFRVPCHITGFFKPVITDDPMKSGSLGAGFSISRYVYTKARKLSTEHIKIYFNNIERTNEACTSLRAAMILLNKFNISGGVAIYHDFEAPIGVGLATSGAGSLGAVFSINSLFNLGLNKVELARIAHAAEVQCKTGLGSVIAQYEGMFEIRLKAGAPGIGRVARFPYREKVAILIRGKISTRDVLSSQDAIHKVIKAFENKHVDLANNFSIEKFCNLSRNFALSSGLMTRWVKNVLSESEKFDLLGSMLMLGEGVFLFGEDLDYRIEKLLSKFSKSEKPKSIIITNIDNDGVTEIPQNE